MSVQAGAYKEIYVALIRGINVGRAKRIAMAELRKFFKELGYSGIRTVLNSGNVLFAARKASQKELAIRLEMALDKRFGIAARVVVVGASDFIAVVNENPLLDVSDNPSRLQVAFFTDPSFMGNLQGLTQRNWSPEAIALGHHAAYLWCPSGVLKSELLKNVGRLTGDKVTMRNWSTVMKLYRLVSDRSH